MPLVGGASMVRNDCGSAPSAMVLFLSTDELDCDRRSGSELSTRGSDGDEVEPGAPR